MEDLGINDLDLVLCSAAELGYAVQALSSRWSQERALERIGAVRSFSITSATGGFTITDSSGTYGVWGWSEYD